MRYELIKNAWWLAEDVAECVIDAMNEGRYTKVNEAIWAEMWNAFTNKINEWDLMRHYQRYYEADFNQAEELFFNDILNCILEIEED